MMLLDLETCIGHVCLALERSDWCLGVKFVFWCDLILLIILYILSAMLLY